MIDFCNDEDIRDLTTTQLDRRLDSITSINGNIEVILSEGYIKDIFNICFMNEKSRHTIKRAKEVSEKCKEKYQHAAYKPKEHEISSILFAPTSAQTEEERSLSDMAHEDAIKLAQSQEPELTLDQRFNELNAAVTKVRNVCGFVGKTYNSLPIEERDQYLDQLAASFPSLVQVAKIRKKR